MDIYRRKKLHCVCIMYFLCVFRFSFTKRPRYQRCTANAEHGSDRHEHQKHRSSCIFRRASRTWTEYRPFPDGVLAVTWRPESRTLYNGVSTRNAWLHIRREREIHHAGDTWTYVSTGAKRGEPILRESAFCLFTRDLDMALRGQQMPVKTESSSKTLIYWRYQRHLSFSYWH